MQAFARRGFQLRTASTETRLTYTGFLLLMLPGVASLIALSLGVAGHCDACLGFHVRALVKAGATRMEVEEALAVAVYMGGGPSLMYAADALTAYEQLMPPAG